jgi:F-type H+-transporting ATPase subunit delta
MNPTRLARRYAEALMGAAEDATAVPAVASDLRQIDGLIRGSRELQLFLKSPVIKKDKKREVLRSIFEGKVHVLTSRTLALLAEKGREEALPFVILEFFRLEDERNGIIEVEVRSATVLSPDQIARLRERFESLSTKKVRIAATLDPSLRGGFRAKMGDTVYDGSVSRQLEILRERFIHVAQN